jgi:predicted HicB family RNase H-like nuclease
MLRVRKNLKVCASIRARKQGRSLNNYLESLLVKDLEPDLPLETSEEIDITFQ